MSTSQVKVKDLIDVRTFASLVDFHADPSETLRAYRFTDITAGMMSAWLSSLTEVSTLNGVSKALAGYRGVGKSHFMAAFSAMISNPDLRAAIEEPFVSASAQHLSRRRYPVAHVHRGAKETLLEELKNGIAVALNVSERSLPDEPEGLLEYADEISGDLPLVILIDTAFDRKARVSRDDGPMLGDLAKIVSRRNLFLAVALDDDITDADGTNLAITQNFSIEFLDQEHLYRIVDGHIFTKNRLNRDIINEVYQYFREVLPAFNWSEERFCSLYPLHPLVLDIAPIVRLYASDFALLNFASEAGRRIMGRPARSLIGLDEVFDNVEETLRKDQNLKESFEVFDKIAKGISEHVPVMERLQAKLILKALFVLSLEGEGATADEISAAMLIFEENAADGPSHKVAEFLELIVRHFEDDLWRTESAGSPVRYSLKLSGKDDLNNALSAAVGQLSTDAVSAVLYRLGHDRFNDWETSTEAGEEGRRAIDCRAIWRGSYRRIRLSWDWQIEVPDSEPDGESEPTFDVELKVCGPDEDPSKVPVNGRKVLYWRPGKLTKSDIDTLLRYHVLLTDKSLRNEYPEQFGAAGHTYSLASEKIWEKAFLRESSMFVEGQEAPLPSETGTPATLEQFLSAMLGPMFDSTYPEHPLFSEPLGMEEVSSLVSDLFSGARIGDDKAQHFAKTFALPLGLVEDRGDMYVLSGEERLYELPTIERVLSLVRGEGEGARPVSLGRVYSELAKAPYGLTSEAQHLLLSALVAQGKIDFVTERGDRIHRRSLDLRIVWEDISGIAKPEDTVYEANRLADWVRILTGEKKPASIDNSQDRKLARAALASWLQIWNGGAVLEGFEAMPSESLNLKIWYTALNTEKSFGKAASAISALQDDSIQLEGALQRIADSFSDSEDVFKERQKELSVLSDYVSVAEIREDASAYLAVSEYTTDDRTERLREELINAIDNSIINPSPGSASALTKAWDAFRQSYISHFKLKHDEVMRSEKLKEKLQEIFQSDEWWEFTNLSRIRLFRQDHLRSAKAHHNRFRELGCEADPIGVLERQPFCVCSFRISEVPDWQDLPKQTIATIMLGNESYRRTLKMASPVIVPALKAVTESGRDGEQAETAKILLSKFDEGIESAEFTTDEIFLIENVVNAMKESPIVQAHLPEITDFLSAEELQSRIDGWLSELPDEPLFLQL